MGGEKSFFQNQKRMDCSENILYEINDELLSICYTILRSDSKMQNFYFSNGEQSLYVRI